MTKTSGFQSCVKNNEQLEVFLPLNCSKRMCGFQKVNIYTRRNWLTVYVVLF